MLGVGLGLALRTWLPVAATAVFAILAGRTRTEEMFLIAPEMSARPHDSCRRFFPGSTPQSRDAVAAARRSGTGATPIPIG